VITFRFSRLKTHSARLALSRWRAIGKVQSRQIEFNRIQPDSTG
jgi:hypothetical protein